jgi:hypothetical protein
MCRTTAHLSWWLMQYIHAINKLYVCSLEREAVKS